VLKGIMEKRNDERAMISRDDSVVISFSELRRVIFEILWEKHKIALYDHEPELMNELQILSKMGFIKIEYADDTIKEIIIDKDNQEKIVRIVGILKNVDSMYRVFAENIERAINESALRVSNVS